jgi:hypothetical protein
MVMAASNQNSTRMVSHKLSKQRLYTRVTNLEL